jgi:hypothetical protein
MKQSKPGVPASLGVKKFTRPQARDRLLKAYAYLAKTPKQKAELRALIISVLDEVGY